ncbi:Holliday junction branch migration protein RuvA [Kallotenue papyrolyticum]|uniref:Holliday junction branch migration protein RuvA n=1 Tax=Kallotenue papyrolyticum TaxID=1325125 RepID=UPI00047854E3|nr:Holliday junction branch migration protein RuvA [Kallotenue papyrolyticum]
MIASLRGNLLAVGPDSAVIETGGIGFQVFVPRPLARRLQVGAEVLLHTYLHVREDALVLYGFESPEQRAFFETLLGVSGVGPRMALSLLSAAPLDQLQLAIARENTALLAQVPGIGKKTAARIVLELKGKLDLGAAVPAVTSGASATVALNSELQEILMSLGYSAAEAQAAVAAVPADAPVDLEERLRLALRYFGGVAEP